METGQNIIDDAIGKFETLSASIAEKLDRLYRENENSGQDIFSEDKELIDNYENDLEEIDNKIKKLSEI